ncbi:MAG TPA: 3-oxoacyl-[acyl-carrier-protein] synthase III C-terminal domain-containing protein [Longimicrobiales bacterium]|nr:3-oxoacyl-[acyl-carrier-protein] synthase III C-terminal domain-containing protein [Longimicrobiales bacterium]
MASYAFVCDVKAVVFLQSYGPCRHNVSHCKSFAVDAFVRTIRTLCESQGIDPSDLDWIVPHQANIRIIEAAAKRLGLPTELFYTNMERYANTSAASIPIAISEMVERGLLKRGHRIVAAGFGAGLAYGGNLLQW